MQNMITLIECGEQAVKDGAKLIGEGELVAFPTETVYGLGGNALTADSVKKIYKAKGRPSDNPLIVHVAEINDIVPLVKNFSAQNRAVAEAFMPGPITLLFPVGDIIPREVTAGLDTVAIRIPRHPIARKFIAACGVPIAAPSANRSTHISPTSAEHVYNDLNGEIPLIIDGGRSEVGIESTVLDLTGEIPTILRPGAITSDMLLTVLNTVKTHSGEVISVAKAPGMKYKHYAPRVDMCVGNDINKINAEYDRMLKLGMKPVILIDSAIIGGISDRSAINLGNGIKEVCSNIYSALHRAETEYDYIICFDYGNEGLAGSVMNRVNKAAAGKRL